MKFKFKLPRIVTVYRDSITGRFVTKKYEEANPSTTEKEHELKK